jgi:hypothetical protein
MYGKFCMCLELTLCIYAAINRGELKKKFSFRSSDRLTHCQKAFSYDNFLKLELIIVGAWLPGVWNGPAHQGGLPAGLGLYPEGDGSKIHPLDQHETGSAL